MFVLCVCIYIYMYIFDYHTYVHTYIHACMHACMASLEECRSCILKRPAKAPMGEFATETELHDGRDQLWAKKSFEKSHFAGLLTGLLNLYEMTHSKVGRGCGRRDAPFRANVCGWFRCGIWSRRGRTMQPRLFLHRYVLWIRYYIVDGILETMASTLATCLVRNWLPAKCSFLNVSDIFFHEDWIEFVHWSSTSLKTAWENLSRVRIPSTGLSSFHLYPNCIPTKSQLWPNMAIDTLLNQYNQCNKMIMYLI